MSYCSFKDEAETLRQLQDEYRSYIAVLKEVVRDTNTSLPLMQPIDSGEKKKSFNVVDRRRAYLKKSLQQYVAEKDTALNTQEIERLYATYNQPLQKKFVKKNTYTKRPLLSRSYQRRRVLPLPVIRRDAMVASCEKVTDMVLAWPIERDKFWLSSFFGPRRKANGSWGYHYGIDLASVKGNSVNAAGAGRVVEAGFANGYGNTVVIVHNDKYKTRYAHLQTIRVRVGQEVSQGQFIGTVGDTGHIRRVGRDGSHLHFEVYSHGRQINPLSVLSWNA